MAASGLSSPAGAQTAQRGFALDRFDPSERGSQWFVLESLDLRGHVRPALGLVLDYAYKPLVAYDANGSELAPIVGHQLFAHLGGSLILWERLRVAANLPVALYQQAPGGAFANAASFQASSAQAAGDLRLGADVRLLGTYGDPATLALGAQVFLPTGSQQNFTGDGKARVQPRLMIAGDAGDLAYAAKVGVTYRAQNEPFAGSSFGTEMAWAASVGVRLAERKLLLGPELYGATTLADPFSKTTAPTELLLGGHYDVGDFRVGLGVGPGITRGFGTPALRIVGAFEWAPGIEKKPEPALPEEPKDRDGDGILDKDDACPDVKGVRSDDPEKNGCPLPKDRDGDGILDKDDACPDVKGIESDDPAKNGCPPSDRDGDKILDTDDACPDEKGEKSDDPKKNGCPPPKDTDKDGIIDPEDACVTTPGPKNADPKRNGCPEARIEQGQIKILEQVQFATNSDRILSVSDTVLQAIQKILSEHPEITKIGVEGHTDNRGNAPYNKKLSQRRAASVVKWLVGHGIDVKRLSSAGFGMERPLDSNSTDDGRQRNRRVEFHIQEIDGKPADPSSVKE
jgi:outer membrane protein OmpA-like peptidoglycan-associated protein